MRKIQLLTLIMAVALATGCAERSWNPTTTSTPQAPDTTVAQTGSTGTIPASTQLVVRTNENIDAKDAASVNRDYDAEMAADVVNENGTVLIPRGSRAKLSVFQTGEDQLVLGLRSVNIDGREYLVQSGELTQSGNEGLGANRRTATHVGGGALLGTLIGAAAGGGKGAAIGAAVGAGAGAAVQVLTKGNEVNVPAETLLTFRLDDAIRLEGYR